MKKIIFSLLIPSVIYAQGFSLSKKLNSVDEELDWMNFLEMKPGKLRLFSDIYYIDDPLIAIEDDSQKKLFTVVGKASGLITSFGKDFQNWGFRTGVGVHRTEVGSSERTAVEGLSDVFVHGKYSFGRGLFFLSSVELPTGNEEGYLSYPKGRYRLGLGLNRNFNSFRLRSALFSFYAPGNILSLSTPTGTTDLIEMEKGFWLELNPMFKNQYMDIGVDIKTILPVPMNDGENPWLIALRLEKNFAKELRVFGSGGIDLLKGDHSNNAFAKIGFSISFGTEADVTENERLSSSKFNESEKKKDLKEVAENSEEKIPRKVKTLTSSKQMIDSSNELIQMTKDVKMKISKVKGPPFPEKIRVKTFLVHFYYDRTIVEKEDQATVLLLERHLRTYGKWIKEVKLSGHTDKRGKLNYNIDLSKKRSEVVRDYLNFKGIKSIVYGLSAHGWKNLKIKNAKSAKEHRENRRVEIRVILRE